MASMVLGDSTPESLTPSVNVPLGWDIYHGYKQPEKHLDSFLTMVPMWVLVHPRLTTVPKMLGIRTSWFSWDPREGKIICS
jgi:hypothetical protein